MKKKMISIALALITVYAFAAFLFSGGSKTLEEAINTPGLKRVNIIHEEKIDRGRIVFSYTPDGNGLYTAIVRKGIGGYKTVYSGIQGDIKLVSEKFGLSEIYFPAIEKTSPPIYFGLIGNPEISRVIIIDKKRNIEGEAKIVDDNGTRIWLAYMDKYEGSDFDIIGLSADGREITKIYGNISPYYANQKPFKGYE